jgi:hypothetical protein
MPLTFSICLNLNQQVYFGAPEFDQKLTWKIISQPAVTPTGLTATIDGDGSPADTVGIRFEWLEPDSVKYGGKWFNFTFEVCDNFVPKKACTTATMAFFVAKCGSGAQCQPEKCVPITDSQCSGPVGPVCTPLLTGEHCDAQYSFPMLISSRYPMIKESLHGSSDILGDDGWWYHYTDDRAGAYSFTSLNGFAAPQLLCCVTSVNELLGTAGSPASSLCFDGSPKWTDPIVIRAEGHHGGTGVFVLPNGLDINGGATRELSVGVGNITLAQVRNYLSLLTPTPKKILVEKFVAGTGSGATATLPNEYKFHMFNGKIGSISAFLNPGQPCACFGEYSEDWECLHTHGCFKSQLPFGTMFEGCYDIDFPVGSEPKYTTGVKGDDLCGPVPPPKACVFKKMKEIAIKLSKAIGVYVRIDMFVTANNEIYVQEYTFNHLGGTKHCAATIVDGCVDSCFLGKNWAEASSAPGGSVEMGGPQILPFPSIFGNGYGGFTDAQQCGIALKQRSVLADNACTLSPGTAPPRPDYTEFPSVSPTALLKA